MTDKRTDERWRVVPDADTRGLVDHVCIMSGRKRADVLREALQIGIEPLVNDVNRRTKDTMNKDKPTVEKRNELTTRPPNRSERRAAASTARKAEPAKTRGKKVTKRKVSASA